MPASDLLLVLSTSAPVAFASDMSVVPLRRACRFSEATPANSPPSAWA